MFSKSVYTKFISKSKIPAGFPIISQRITSWNVRHHSWCFTEICVWTSSWGAAGVTADTQPLIFWCNPSLLESDNCTTRYDFVNTNLLHGGDAGFRESGCHLPISSLSLLFLIPSHPRMTVSYFIWWVCGAAALWDKNTHRISIEPPWSEPKLYCDNECTLTHALRKDPTN